MGDGIFVTGGGGFVGRRLVAALADLGRPLVALQHSALVRSETSGKVAVVAGDLLNPASYAIALRSCRTVVHLAATTGRATATEHRRTNATGTATLLDAAKAAGVGEFLFVSSIAAAFPEERSYAYAATKRAAEEQVRQSGLSHLIVRPTMILGPDAPVLASLEKLALLPLMVVPGTGRVRVQPLHVDDLVRCLVTALREHLFNGATITLGGPDVVTVDRLLATIREVRTGRTGRAVHVPLPLLQVPLRAAEAAHLVRVLPITAGQLSSFKYDGVAAPNEVQTRTGGPWRSLSEMLVPRSSTAAADAQLLAECRLFVRHLVGSDANPYILGKYADAHRVLAGLAPASTFDRLLLSVSRLGRLPLALADAYSAVFARGSALRKKLVLTLALLETAAPFYERIDAEAGGSPVPALLRLSVLGISAALMLVIGTLVMLPLRLIAVVLPNRVS